MLKYIVLLKGVDKELAKFEFEAVFETYFKEKVNLVCIRNQCYVFSSKKDLAKKDFSKIFNRIAFTHYLGKLFFEGSLDEFISFSKTYDYSFLEGKSFAIRFKKMRVRQEIKYSPAELAECVWDRLKTPKVDLENPDYKLGFVFREDIDYVFVCLVLFENEKEYLGRMPKFRPVSMPYTLKADLSRACVNFLGLKSGVVLDPFAGIGGILLEAIDLGFKVIGHDISWNDLKYMKENIEYYFPKTKYLRVCGDSRFQFLSTNSIDGIVTDIPYGRCSRKLGTDLYENFLKSAKEYLKPNARLVVVYANFVDFRKLALKYFEEVLEVSMYINRSMTRHVLILKNTKNK